MSINIAGTRPVEDENYRYKMPPIIPKIEGRGNGIKTVLVNISDVAMALNRDAPELTKFFGFELGSQTTFSDDGRDIRAVVNGAHSSQDLQTMLSKYIENFVLCKNCHLPETHYKSKGGVINQKCLACGEKSPCDMTHKLTGFIVKNHKKDKKSEDSSKKSDKKTAESEAGAAATATPASPSKGGAASSGSEKKSSSKKSKDAAARGDDLADGADGDVEILESDALGNTTSCLVLNDAMFNFVCITKYCSLCRFVADTAVEQFRRWQAEHPSATHTGMVSYESLAIEELRLIQTRLSLRPMDRISKSLDELPPPAYPHTRPPAAVLQLLILPATVLPPTACTS
jgi:translation initiation factor 2 beta subunit (eIF-2beta)/eIF-5